MTNPTNSTRPSRGRPPVAAPAGRELADELAQLKAWLEAHPLHKPGTISVAAGLHRAALGHVLRGYRSPQAEALDAIYKVLNPYGYIPQLSGC